jgi:hypothetical protein
LMRNLGKNCCNSKKGSYGESAACKVVFYNSGSYCAKVCVIILYWNFLCSSTEKLQCMTKHIFSIALFNDASELSWKKCNDCSAKFCPKQFTNELRFNRMLRFILNVIMSTSWSYRSGLMKMNFSGWTKTSSSLGKHEYCSLKTIWKSKNLNEIGLRIINFVILF